MFNIDSIETYVKIVDKNESKQCFNKIHYEPMLISVPYNKTIVMKCPDCGEEIIINGSNITF